MTRTRPTLIAAALGAGCAALLAACGSGTKTVTVSSAPLTPTQTSSKPKTTSSGTTTTPTTPAPNKTSGGKGSATTRSAPEPAFTQQEAKAAGVSGAAAVVRAKGYTPNDTSDYHSDQALRVLVGTRTGSADGYGQQAFFFVNGRYIGTDAKEPSATLKIVSQGDTEVTLAYPLYRKNDPLSSPSGGQARVTFQLNNGKLVPLGKIPPVNSSTGLSRQ
jgi:LppP/LprE lipoprotein